MAKKKSSKSRQMLQEELDQVDIFYLPKPVAEMYRILREAVKEEALDWGKNQFAALELVSDVPEEGQALAGFDQDQEEVFRFYLNPQNISKAQEARDKGHLPDFLEQFITKKA